MKQVTFSAKGEKPKVTREQALRVARQLGCRGAHESEDGSWLPCGSQSAFDAIQKGKEEYLRNEAKKKAEVIPAITRRVEKLYTKSNAYFENRADAEVISKRNGCNSVRTVILGGNKYYAPCSPKAGWEELREGGIVGINTLTDGSLTSTPIAGKDLDVTEIDAKGFVNFVSRSTDPDVFSDPDSARIRARNLGCIGVRRYTARDGKTVWLPCSNGSDYNRTMGIGGDNKPRRRGSKTKSFATGGIVIHKGVPKPKKQSPIIGSDVVNNLAVKVRKHNASVDKPESKTNLRDLKLVFTRGLEDSDEKGAFKRVSDFLSLLSTGKPKDPKYRQDNDLLPLDHPWKKSKTAVKSGGFDDGSYGVKFSGCCPKSVKRYRKL